jgi:uncharacterized protein YprB with RNaseH-like and TPR domain
MRLAVVDLECSTLKADQGFLICAGFKPLGERGYVIGYEETGFKKGRYHVDKWLVRRVCEEMARYDGWITWNGLMFDLPYLDDRLLCCEEGTIPRRFARGLDMMWHARQGKSTFQSSRLDWVAKALRCPFEKTPLDIQVWKEAEAEVLANFTRGRSNTRYVVQHCLADLRVTEFVYEKLKHRIQSISKR